MSVRVVVVDDGSAMRVGVRTIVTQMGFTVVGEGKNGSEAIDLVTQHKPDMILLDINMPVMTGIEAIEPILKISPSTRVVMMTSVSDSASVDLCLDKGATNYILKTAPRDEIAQSIREALASAG